MTKLLFSSFDVTRQVFFRSRLSFGLVNLKPIVPGHVLVVPKRAVPRLSDLTQDEITDLFSSVQTVGAQVEKAFAAQALTVACQDGPAAGQSVPHVHVHILPRKFTDFNGNNDAVYPALEDNEATLLLNLSGVRKPVRQELKVDNEGREPRSSEEMEKEAEWLAGFFSDKN